MGCRSGRRLNVCRGSICRCRVVCTFIRIIPAKKGQMLDGIQRKTGIDELDIQIGKEIFLEILWFGHDGHWLQ